VGAKTFLPRGAFLASSVEHQRKLQMEERIKRFQITLVKVMHPGFVSVGFTYTTLIYATF